MKKLFTIVALCATVMACQKEPAQQEVPSEKPSEPVPINLALGVQTKVSDTQFDENDQVGIYVVNHPNSLASSGNFYDNVLFTKEYWESWSQEKELFWYDMSLEHDFYCYHPYSSYTDPRNIQFSVASDQTDNVNYKASDFVRGTLLNVTPTMDQIQIQAKHLLSNVVIKLVKGSGFLTDKWNEASKSVTINNVYRDATIDLLDGNVTAKGTQTNVQAYNNSPDYFRAVIVPQYVSHGNLITIKINEGTYQFQRDFDFLSGKQHTFTITVNRTGSGVDIGVGDWESDGTENGGTAE